MKLLLLLTVALSSAVAQYAPTLPHTGYPALDQFLLTRPGFAVGPTLPATCTPGADFFLLNSPVTLKFCKATNVWDTVPIQNGIVDFSGAVSQKSRQGSVLPTTCTAQNEEFLLVSGVSMSAKYININAAPPACTWTAQGIGGPVDGVFLPGAFPVRLLAANVGTGDTILYTVPAGKRMFLGTVRAVANGTYNCYPEVRIGGTWYQIGNVLTSGSLSEQTGFVLEAGQSAGINCAFAVGQNVNSEALQFDNTGSPTLRSYYVAGPSTGNNTLVTTAAGHIDAVVGVTAQSLVGPGSMSFVTDSGGTRNFGEFVLPSGGSLTQINNTHPQNASTSAVAGYETVLYPGDSAVVNVDVGNAAQFAWINVLEF